MVGRQRFCGQVSQLVLGTNGHQTQIAGSDLITDEVAIYFNVFCSLMERGIGGDVRTEDRVAEKHTPT